MLYDGGCHCGRIAFEVEGEFKDGLECNCSICRKRGGILGFVPREQMRLTTPEENLSTYTFNSHKIVHHFCDNCGVAPFATATSPDGVAMAAINLRCLPAVDLGALRITFHDGASQ